MSSDRFLSLVSGIPNVLEKLLDEMEDLVFFAKDLDGRYRLVNQTLVHRVGKRSKGQLIGRRTDELFPAPFGDAFRAQDEQVLETGRGIEDRLELHLYPRRLSGWCRTFKMPMRDEARIVGLMGFSKDLHRPASDTTPAGVARALEHLETHLHRRIRVGDLAAVADMATRTFERAVQDLFRISAGDLIIQTRISHACRLLQESSLSIAHIAQECGYAEHSSFTRQFRSRVGMTPKSFRASRSGQSRVWTP